MKLLNNIKGETTERIFLFETCHNIYDDNKLIECADMVTVFNRTYFIDRRVDTENSITVYGHKYDRVRKIKHELVFVIDWNTLHYHYNISKYDIA